MRSNNLTTLHGLAKKLNLPFLWLKAEADAGRIPSLRIGRKHLFNIDAVVVSLSKRAAQPDKRTPHAID